MRIVLIFLFFFIPFLISAQRHDNHFVFGGGVAEAPKRKSDLHFSQGKAKVDTFTVPFRYMIARSVGGISDSIGNLLFYTNGCEILNIKNKIMQNGDSLNPGAGYKWSCTKFAGFDLMRGLMVLPYPGHIDRYILVHLNDKKNPRYPDQMLYTVVDMSMDNGLGAVTEKNHLVFEAPFADLIAATRHANGRDWWFLIPKQELAPPYTNGYYSFLLDPKGLHFRDSFFIGRSDLMQFSTQAAFSPDGSLYARLNNWGGVVQLLQFDRCTGRLCCPKEITMEKGDGCGSLCFSSNQRFLYISTCRKLSQYDILGSGTIAMKIDTFDGTPSPEGGSFFQQFLAPDNKIYIGSTSSLRKLHVIHHPDSLGKACKFLQHDFEVYSELNIGVVNFPNFKLKNLTGSQCDTLYKAPPKPNPDCSICKTAILIKPNPVQGEAIVETLPCVQGDMHIYDVLGRPMVTKKIDQTGRTLIDLHGFFPGIYFIEVSRIEGRCVVQMVVER